MIKENDFNFTLTSEQLSRGLRPSKEMPRNSGYLVECRGAIGMNSVLQALAQLTRIDTSAIATAFPYPQLFVFTNFIIVCNQTAIYEWRFGTLVPKLSGLAAGFPWLAVDFFDYIYLSNGNQAVVRSSSSGEYSVTSALPKASAVCNFNGQVLIGAFDVEAEVTALVMPVGTPNLVVTAHGEHIIGKVFPGTVSVTVEIRGEVG